MITINGSKVEIFKFPSGEMNARIPSFTHIGKVTIKTLLKNSDDIMALLLTVDAVRRLRINIEKFKLILPYFPYARQDRVCNLGEAFSLSVMANLINSLNFDHVDIYDPHSDVTPALIKNCNVIAIKDMFCELDLVFEDQVLVIPDAGMVKKAHTILNKFSGDILCLKERNLCNGDILNVNIYKTGNIKNRHLIIVDDICDGGATFIKLAIELRKYDPASLSLYVTHGVFSRGLHELFRLFDNVYCYYTFLENPDSRLQIIGDIYV